MTIPRPLSFRIGATVGACLRLLFYGVMLASWGGLWILLLVGLLWPRRDVAETENGARNGASGG